MIGSSPPPRQKGERQSIKLRSLGPMKKKASTQLLVTVIAFVAIAAATDQAESERKWLGMSGTVIKTLEALQAHNATLPPPPAEPRDTGLRLRVLTFNIHNFRGYPEDLGTARWKSDPQEKLDIQLRTLGMLDAHLASLQECDYDKPLQLRLIDRLGYLASFFPASHHKHCAGATLSRYPLPDNLNLTFLEMEGQVVIKRFLGRSLVRLPGGQEILIYGGHYDPVPDAEMDLIEEVCRIDRALKRPMIWMGDWNIQRSHVLYKRFHRMGLVDAFVHLDLPHTTTSLKGDRTRGGIDYIFFTPDIAGRLESIEIVARGPAALDPNDPQSIAASDHLPVLAVFRF